MFAIQVTNAFGDILFLRRTWKKRWGGLGVDVAIRSKAKLYPTQADAEAAIELLTRESKVFASITKKQAVPA